MMPPSLPWAQAWLSRHTILGVSGALSSSISLLMLFLLPEMPFPFVPPWQTCRHPMRSICEAGSKSTRQAGLHPHQCPGSHIPHTRFHSQTFTSLGALLPTRPRAAPPSLMPSTGFGMTRITEILSSEELLSKCWMSE